MQELIEKYYEEFKGIGSPAIVRSGQKNDAFEIVVLKVLYGRYLDFSFDKDHIDDIKKYVISPPDSKIDIFVENGDGDESTFDVIQVKNTSLKENELKTAISDMERTIKDYCNSPINVSSESCREILSSSSLDKNGKKRCQYYVIHTGTVREFPGIQDNEHIITEIDLKAIYSCKTDRVDAETLTISDMDGCISFGSSNEDKEAIICNINGYDLAELSVKYDSTEVGRNILFGQNLRESLNPRSSKSYAGMEKTVRDCPDYFWYYNNGITIIAEKVKQIKKESETLIELTNFSIVNGAQTTSSLGLILEKAKRDRQDSMIESLKKTFVLARILKLKDQDAERSVAIYNNTQNPIKSRDMVVHNEEQKKLYEWLLDSSYPQIYMETKRGSRIPNSFDRSFSHRKTTNESLAQLAYAGFLLRPFTAKDKKASLFNNDISQSEFTLNEVYHRIFNLSLTDPAQNGVLFHKTKTEIDELLFSQQLYKEGKIALKREIQSRLDLEKEEYEKETDADQKLSLQSRIERDSTLLEAIGVSMFYYVATYYEFYSQYGKKWKSYRYDYDMYYNDKSYRTKMIKQFSEFFLTRTSQILIETAKRNGKSGNINNWVRSLKCETEYMEELRNKIGFEMDLAEKYKSLMDEYKVVPL